MGVERRDRERRRRVPRAAAFAGAGAVVLAVASLAFGAGCNGLLGVDLDALRPHDDAGTIATDGNGGGGGSEEDGPVVIVDASTRDTGLGADTGTVSNNPFDEASCSGPPMTDAEARARLGGSTFQTVGAFAIVGRSRRCQGSTCPDWTTIPIVVAGGAAGSSITFPTPSTGEFGLTTVSQNNQVYLRLWTAQVSVSNTLRWRTATCAAVGAPLDCAALGDDVLWFGNEPSPQAIPWQLGPRGATVTAKGGLLTNQCFRLHEAARFAEGGGTIAEFELAFLGRF